MTAQREDDKKEGALGPPSTPYILKSGKVKAIPQPDFSDAADSQIAGSPLSTPLRHDGVARPTPKKTPQQHSAYVDAFYTQESGLSVNTKVPIPKCTRQGVYTIPSSSSLQKMSEDQLKAVPNFTVKKDGCGAIQFLDPVDVRGLDIDSIIEFTQHSIAVYPNEDHKPEPGRGLNVPAVISLERCWPLDPITNRPSTDDEELSRFAKRLKSMQLILHYFLHIFRKMWPSGIPVQELQQTNRRVDIRGARFLTRPTPYCFCRHTFVLRLLLFVICLSLVYLFVARHQCDC